MQNEFLLQENNGLIKRVDSLIGLVAEDGKFSFTLNGMKIRRLTAKTFKLKNETVTQYTIHESDLR